MHKLAKGLKKKKKQKKGKKGAEEEFDPEELERYRRERAEAQQKAEESGDATAAGTSTDAGSDEWKKFQALTAGVDSILKKTQGDLDRIKSNSYFQRKAPLENEKKSEEESKEEERKSKKWVGFDEEGNPIEGEPPESGQVKKEEKKPLVNEDGFVDVPDDDDARDDSADEDIFDTTYVDVLEKIDVHLAYVSDSPVEEDTGDDPFDTTNAEKVLKTVDKKGNKLVSLGNAVEVLAGRIDHVSTCKLTKGNRRPRTQQDLLLDDFVENDKPSEPIATEAVKVEKTLLDDDSDLPDVPVDLTKLPPVLPQAVTPREEKGSDVSNEGEKASIPAVDVSEFEVLKEKTILEEIPDLDDTEFDLDALVDYVVHLEQAEDPFSAKEPKTVDFQNEIIEASFEAATFVGEKDPFDTTFADNILPGKTELKFIEKELEELPVSEVSISLTDPAGLSRDYETGLLKPETKEKSNLKRDLLGGSTTDLSRLADQPIAPAEEITYVDPFDTSSVKEIPPGKTELKVLEQELLGGDKKASGIEEDDDFDPRKDEPPPKSKPPPRPPVPIAVTDLEEQQIIKQNQALGRKTSRPEALDLAPAKVVAFELPTPSKKPDLLATTEEEKSLPSKPLTPYYTQKSIDKSLPTEEEEEQPEAEVDPFDTSFVAKVAPGKTELKLIESELLKEESGEIKPLPHSLSDHEFDPRSAETEITRRQSDFSIGSVRPDSLKINEIRSLLKKVNEEQKQPKRPPVEKQESLLDAEVDVDAKPLTPRIEPKVIEEEEISYTDPFDTSIATNILPGKAELRVLENELKQILETAPTTRTTTIKIGTAAIPSVEDPDFDPRAEEKTSQDFLSSADQELQGAKVLTPLQNTNRGINSTEVSDPFDTSFATLDPGKTELKLLETELMKK